MSQKCEEMGLGEPEDMSATLDWSESTHLEFVNAVGTSESIISITSPGTRLTTNGDNLARLLSRDCNLLRRSKKEKIRKVWVLGSAAASRYREETRRNLLRLRQLSADGIGVLIDYRGLYLCDPVLDPVFAMLDQKKAKVHIYPTGPSIVASVTVHLAPQPAIPLPQYPSPMLEFLVERALLYHVPLWRYLALP
ncbi:hypothetical protein MMC08_002966 [Hypocenomyce scalaris]|nr:hypothetical protein [Hypocenomyce scalaris]